MNEKLIKFTLPSPDSAASVLDQPERATTPAWGRILVAEDDPVYRTLIETRLRQWGYDVVVTNDGAQAMAVLRGPNPPFLAVLDWSMPEMDGLEICRRLRAVDKMVYIILLTARSTRENLIEGLEAGADSYLVKPFDADELHARIRVGLRSMISQQSLAARVYNLERAIADGESLKLRIPL